MLHLTQWRRDLSTLLDQRQGTYKYFIGLILYFEQSLDNLLLSRLNNIAIDISTVDKITLYNAHYMLKYSYEADK